MAKKKQEPDPLSNWTALNAWLLRATEDEAEKLLAREQEGAARERVLLRIHSRLNRLRAHRERDGIKGQAR